MQPAQHECAPVAAVFKRGRRMRRERATTVASTVSATTVTLKVSIFQNVSLLLENSIRAPAKRGT